MGKLIRLLETKCLIPSFSVRGPKAVGTGRSEGAKAEMADAIPADVPRPR